MELAHLHIEAQNGTLSTECVDRGIISFLSFIEWVEQLPYKRNTNRAEYTLVLDEECGTCSTKNALIKALAIENNWGFVKLFLGMYKMTEETNPGVGKLLDSQGLDYLPEAHSYLKINNVLYDCTGLPEGKQSFMSSLLTEIEINPSEIGKFKVDWHRKYLEKWSAKNTQCSLDQIWELRETCIQVLS